MQSRLFTLFVGTALHFRGKDGIIDLYKRVFSFFFCYARIMSCLLYGRVVR